MDSAEPLPIAVQWSVYLARDRRRSEHTVRAYRATAERLIAFLTVHWGRPVDRRALAAVEAADLRAYLAQRRGGGLTNASAARELSAVRGFLDWANGDGAVPRRAGANHWFTAGTPMANVVPPSPRKKPPTSSAG